MVTSSVIGWTTLRDLNRGPRLAETTISKFSRQKSDVEIP